MIREGAEFAPGIHSRHINRVVAMRA